MSLTTEDVANMRRAWASSGPPPPPVQSRNPPATEDADLLDFHSQQVYDKWVLAKDSGDKRVRLPPLVPTLIDSRRKNLDTWLIFSDAHIPFEKADYLDLVIEIGRTIKPYGIAIIGDWGDLLSVSSHPKLPHHYRWQLRDEVEAVNARLDQVDSIGAKERKFFTGNHDIRGQRLAMRQMIGLYETLDPGHLYNLHSRGWTVYPYQQHATIGKVHVVHDIGHSGKYAMWQNGDAVGASTMQGHTHNAGCVYFGSALGSRHISSTIGWLGDEQYAEYMAPIKKTRNWQHAFGLAYVERDTKNTHVSVTPIVDGRAVVEGQQFEANITREAA